LAFQWTNYLLVMCSRAYWSENHQNSCLRLTEVINFLTARLLNYFNGSVIEPLKVQFLLDGREKSYRMLKGRVVDSLIGATQSEALSYPNRSVFLGAPKAQQKIGQNRNWRVLIPRRREGDFRCTFSGQLKVIRSNKFGRVST
jgi:hypothetical protein